MARKKINTTQVRIVLQGKTESFEDYEKRLNKMLLKINQDALVVPSASADGRLCCVINFIHHNEP